MSIMRKTVRCFSLLLIGIFLLNACEKDGLHGVANQMEFASKLSEYPIYQGELKDLVPTTDYHQYELGTGLFSDHSEKQRLIKLPAGQKMKAVGEGLPDFPDGTTLVKTFYYWNNAQQTSMGRRVMETRLLMKDAGVWNAAVYLWNEEQTEAYKVESGYTTTVNFIDKQGKGQVLAYHIPSNRECSTCHSGGYEFLPIGPKMRHLNQTIERGTGSINQLDYWQQINLLEPVDPSTFPVTPDWHDTSIDLHARARAYMDVNCGHCHRDKGYSSDRQLFLSYEYNFEESYIEEQKDDIVIRMERNEMPYLGTSVIDEEGLALIKEYVNSL